MAYSKVQKIGFKIAENLRKEVDGLGFELYNYSLNNDLIAQLIGSEDIEDNYAVFSRIEIKYNDDCYLEFENKLEFDSGYVEERAADYYWSFKEYVLFKNKEYNDLKMKYDLLKISLDSQEKTKRRM